MTGFSLIEIFLSFRVLRLRVLELFNATFELDLRHYAMVLLHPCYRQLKDCLNVERGQGCSYVREEMKKIVFESKRRSVAIVANKKSKFLVSILQEHEYDGNAIDNSKVDDDSSGNDEFGYNVLQPDELARYLSMELDKSTLSLNSLQFWNQYQRLFPTLSIVARKVHCIPASSVAVERCFSSIGFIINELRTSLHPDQIDNRTVIRSMEKLKK